MQHFTLEFPDIEAMIAACPHAVATPMIRLPDAQEWHIQHATDSGALGVVIPTVDDVARAREAGNGARNPKWAGVARERVKLPASGASTVSITANDNMLVLVVIETPTGVANAYDIASVPGVDVVIIGKNDLSSFSRLPQNDDRYQAMVTKVHDDTLRGQQRFSARRTPLITEGIRSATIPSSFKTGLRLTVGRCPAAEAATQPRRRPAKTLPPRLLDKAASGGR